MNLPQIIVLLATLLAIAFICRLYGKLAKERAKRIGAVQTLLLVKSERDEWVDTAQAMMLAKGARMVEVCRLKREVTTLNCQLDSMINGDRRCPNGHRFYSGEGITCPRCNAIEVATWKRTPPFYFGQHVQLPDQWQNGADSAEAGIDVRSFEVTLTDLSAEWKVCAGCGKPSQKAWESETGKHYCITCLPF